MTGARTTGSALELIMTAPMVVASWINLQYYGPTVNNRAFGSATGAAQCGRAAGVLEGNSGDLRWDCRGSRFTTVSACARAAAAQRLHRSPRGRDQRRHREARAFVISSITAGFTSSFLPTKAG